jgi:hypothetical protein
MKPCIPIEEFTDLANTWSGLFATAMKYPDETSGDACIEFSEKVAILQTMLKVTYRDFALSARETETPADEMSVWLKAISYCDSLAETMTVVLDRFPHCGTQELHDLALDYRSSCMKRFENARKGLACKKTGLPKNLFPEMN